MRTHSRYILRALFTCYLEVPLSNTKCTRGVSPSNMLEVGDPAVCNYCDSLTCGSRVDSSHVAIWSGGYVILNPGYPYILPHSQDNSERDHQELDGR